MSIVLSETTPVKEQSKEKARAKPLKTSSDRILPLDGIRGLTLLVVVLFHYLNNQYIATNPAQLNKVELAIMKVTGLGWISVNLFFILSGFLIGSILLQNRTSKNYFKVFYIRRFLRIIPAYYLLLLVFYLVQSSPLNGPGVYMFENSFPLGYYFGFVQNFVMGINGNFGPQALTPTWSLAVEEQFYLIIPMVVYFLNNRNLRIFIIACLVLAPVFRYNAPNWYAEYTWIFCRIDSPIFGFALAYLVSHQWFVDYMERNVDKLKWLLISTVVVFGSIYAFTRIGFLNHTILGFIFTAMVLQVLYRKKGAIYKLLTSKPLLTLGKYSYSIYLFHQFFNCLFHLVILNESTPSLGNKWSYVVTALAAVTSFFFSKLSFKYLEGPLLRVGHSYKY